MPITPAIFSEINRQIAEDVKDELRLQGHKAFGRLEQSFKTDEIFLGDEIVLQATALAYIEELEKGVDVKDIHITAQDFQRLVAWVRLRGLGTNFTPEQISYFIIQKWKKFGKPLETSRQFSATGEITNAIEIALNDWKEKHTSLIDLVVIKEFDDHFAFQIKSGTI